jgi:ELWxxDGT repeat protein
MTNVNETLFFEANDGATGRELWKSDGTEAGTVRVKDILPGDGSSYPGSLTNVNGMLVFRARDGTSGDELWKSDGTESGTVLVKDISPGSARSVPRLLTNVNGTLFFEADDGIHGRELWKLVDLPDLPGDTNGDGRVSLDDLNNVRNHFGQSGAGVIGDTNGDGVVNVDDLNNVLNNFGATVDNQAAPSNAAKSSHAAARLVDTNVIGPLARQRLSAARQVAVAERLHSVDRAAWRKSVDGVVKDVDEFFETEPFTTFIQRYPV